MLSAVTVAVLAASVAPGKGEPAALNMAPVIGILTQPADAFAGTVDLPR